ncbi:hypothetical protein RHSIM_Rhsim01G0163700 [Rhododendron simsii]|uniref:t-SNARE coiled-coil homology domain-containing protein n=2 Tax=Rhododendron TaxID=4346 RepID=A0A834LYC4_RHOSS|nr:hypothetical protein RHSIM_Rhsim01G0163700 [Rhododendron simsii]
MSVIDLITRVDAICQKYEKYDVDKHKEVNVSGDDAFARLGVFLFSRSITWLYAQKSESPATAKNRATAVAINAEIRRIKARLLEEVPKLQRLAHKKVKGLSREELEARTNLVSVLKERIEAIPDGSTTNNGSQQTGGWAASASSTGIRFDTTSDRRFDNEYFQHTEESNNFRQEYEMRKMRQADSHVWDSSHVMQDEGLDVIAEGLDTLKNMANDLNEELDRQVPLMDEIDDKVDRATSDLKNTNVRLKDTVTKLRSSRNFCIDIILLCIILGIAAYLYNVLK